MADKNLLKIEMIRNGIVIDHINHGRALEVLKILGIDSSFKNALTFAMNVPSKDLGRKDIVKVENRDIYTSEINKIALIAPDATVNVIKDFEVVRKEKVVLPDIIMGIIRCPNPKCVSNKPREPVSSVFYVKSADPLVLSCKYCEREAEAPFILA